MASIDPQNWARRVADDLIVGGERVPFERVLRAHADTIAAMRGQGLTWASLARLLERAGVRRPQGKSYSADHLRISFQRLVPTRPPARKPASGRKRAAMQVGKTVPQAPSREEVGPARTTPMQPARAARSKQQTPTVWPPTPDVVSEPFNEQDVSGDEINNVLSRLCTAVTNQATGAPA